MPARKSRGNNRGSSQKKGKTGGNKSFLKFLFSAPVILAIIFVVIICLLIAFWPQISSWFNDLGSDIRSALSNAWQAVFRLMGAGIILALIAFAGILVIIGWPRAFLRNWNYWLGAAFFMAVAWGLMGFLRPDSGTLSQVTLGGYIGQAIITQSLVAGIFILLILFFIGLVLLAPEWVWDRVRHTSKGTAQVVGEIVDVVKENNHKQKTAPAAEEPAEPEPVEQEKPVEVPAYSDTGVMDRMRTTITVGGWSLPNINILDKVAEFVISDAEIEKRKTTIEEALASYGVEARVIEVNRGPTVTQFGVEPGWDRKYKEIREKDGDGNISTRQEEVARQRVKVERINSLANDLALALAA
ncbi:MAG: hypothetical protein JXA01_00890, partial [Dehalococcoidia bacterium]|nr:hypothetical protein [Dehalococcoidia bacterium]